MVFPKVKCPEYHAEYGRRVQGRGIIVPSAGTSNDARDRGVGGRHGGKSVTVVGAFKHAWR